MNLSKDFSHSKTHAKKPIMLAIRMALFGASLLPLQGLAQANLSTTQTNLADPTDDDLVNMGSSGTFGDIDHEMLNIADDVSDDVQADTSDDGNAPTTHADDVGAFGDDTTNTQDAQAKPSHPTTQAKTTSPQTSLDKLATFYHAKPSQTNQPQCQGVWVHPSEHQDSLVNTFSKNGHDTSMAGAFYAQADYGYYNNDDYAELSGDVILEQNGQQVRADKVTFNPKTGESSAQGQVLFADMKPASSARGVGMIGVANKLNYNSHDQSATATDVAFASTAINAHGSARQMQKVDENRYQLEQVMFTTCPPTQRKWHLDAQSIEINSQTGRGIAKNSTLKIANKTVLYLPYFNFPIDERRSTGFLLPSIGFNSISGVEVTTPYYVNIAPNFDATISPTLFTNRNPMISGEFRYLTAKLGSGVLTGSYLPKDRQYEHKNRGHVFFDHQWQSKRLPNLSAYANYRHVSDNAYLSDFDKLGLDNNPLNLPRRVGVNYHNEHINAYLKAETFQTLDGFNADGSPITDKDKPYSRLPHLHIDYTLPKFSSKQDGKLSFDKLQINGIHDTAYFKKSIKDGSESEKSGIRMYNQLTASYPMLRPWGYITPKLSLHHLYTSYDEDSLDSQNLSKKDGRHSVFAPQISVDTGVFLEKSGSPFGLFDDRWGGYQVLSPRLKYTYTPYKNQSDIPNFETAVAAISYDQLLEDSWFLGYDRIQDLHAITPALSYRYVDNQGGLRLEAQVAEQFYLSDAKVNIHNQTTLSPKRSGTAWQLSTQAKQNLWLDASGTFTSDYKLNHLTAQLRYQPSPQHLFNIGVVERKDNPRTGQQALSAYTGAALFPIDQRWHILTQAQYDRKNSRLLEGLVGVNYEDCCYGISVYARHYRNPLNHNARSDTAIMAEIRLNGISKGGRLNRLMTDKVLGYQDTQYAWRRAY